MKSTIRVAAINCRYLEAPAEADSHSKKFDAAVPFEYVDRNMEKTFAFLHEAGRSNVDIVCTNEDFRNAGTYVRDMAHPHIFSALAETIPGPLSEKLGEIARQYKMYIAANYYEKDADKIYNTSVLIGRDGGIVGKYRKVHPADGERWRVTGGDKIPVFDTDIGKIGFAICYDINFPELSKSIAMNGADIIIHQTQGWGTGGKASSITGEAFMRTRAAENYVYLIVAKNMQSDGGKSCILDNYGSIMAESAPEKEGLVIAEFAPDYDMDDEYNFDNFYAGVFSTKARQLLARVPSLYSAITEEHPPVLEKYKGMKLHATHEEAKAILKKWAGLDGKERAKYHW